MAKVIMHILFYIMVLLAGFTFWLLTMPLVEYLGLHEFASMNLSVFLMGYLVGRYHLFLKHVEL